MRARICRRMGALRMCSSSSAGGQGVLRAPTQAVVALGSNVGDRVANLRAAVAALTAGALGEAEAGGASPGAMTRVLRWSCLYESSPRYMTDQPAFLNAAVLLETTLPPSVLLSLLKQVEHDMGREAHGERYGPRVIDLDIALYGAARMRQTTRARPLEVPHARLHERDFVLAPLNDLRLASLPQQSQRGFAASGSEGQKPAARPSAFVWEREESDAIGGVARAWQAAQREARGVGGEDMRRVAPLGGMLWPYEQQPLTMGVLNLTPDSFSDGGAAQSQGVAAALAHAHALADRGAAIIDIGGQSTRPGAERVIPEEEAKRVLPAVRAIAADARLAAAGVTVSVDTFYASVAQSAIEAGAHVINDISGGRFDSGMYATMARHPHVAYCLMHSRADPLTMQDAPNLRYSGGVARGVAQELQRAAMRAHAAGVAPWQLWLDPGVGFAKSHLQSAELVGAVEATRETLRGGALQRAPVLVGSSRKGFLNAAAFGALPDARNRDGASTAAAAIAAADGANVLRMHDAAGGVAAAATGAYVREARRLSILEGSARGGPAEGLRREALRQCGAFGELDAEADSDPFVDDSDGEESAISEAEEVLVGASEDLVAMDDEEDVEDSWLEEWDDLTSDSDSESESESESDEGAKQ